MIGVWLLYKYLYSHKLRQNYAYGLIFVAFGLGGKYYQRYLKYFKYSKELVDILVLLCLCRKWLCNCASANSNLTWVTACSNACALFRCYVCMDTASASTASNFADTIKIYPVFCSLYRDCIPSSIRLSRRHVSRFHIVHYCLRPNQVDFHHSDLNFRIWPVKPTQNS